MLTDPECKECFLRQALSTARLSSDDPKMHNLIVFEIDKLLEKLDMQLSPPENAVGVYQLIADLSGVKNPFAGLKDESNNLALSIRSDVRGRIKHAADPLYTAVRYAIAGNIIDYGAQHTFDAMQTLSGCLEENLFIDDYGLLQGMVKDEVGKQILYLADNSGEIVFDGLLIEQLQEHGNSVTLVVRGDEILNDVTMQDITAVGIDKICSVISNGTSCPGTPLKSSSPELQQAFGEADMIISKGQGNFETLSEIAGPIFFLLTVKCPVVAKHISSMRSVAGGALEGRGEMVLMRREK